MITLLQSVEVVLLGYPNIPTLFNIHVAEKANVSTMLRGSIANDKVNDIFHSEFAGGGYRQPFDWRIEHARFTKSWRDVISAQTFKSFITQL